VIPPASPGELTAAVLADLERRGQAESVLGKAAAGLAARIDVSVVDTGASYAALVRELRSTLEALEALGRPASPVDELRAKREERLRGRG
jgi:hypothetical protein